MAEHKRKGPPPGTGGRPPKRPEERRILHAVRIAPETDAILQRARRQGESLGQVIDRLIQQAAGGQDDATTTDYRADDTPDRTDG